MDINVKRIVFAAQNTVKCSTDRLHFDVPEYGALIETRYSCISAGTELAKLTGKQAFRYPSEIGNRAVGRVLEVGRSCSRFQPGDLVFAHTPHASVAETNGLLAHLPNKLDRPEAALIGLASVAITGVRVAQPELGDTAVVLGAGLVGQFAAQLLAIDGVRVILVDPVKERLDIARKCGIKHVIDAGDRLAADKVLDLTDGAGAEHILDCSGVPSVIASAPAMARKGGQIVLMGSPRGLFEMDLTGFLNAFHIDRPHGDLTLRGAHEWKIPLYPTEGLKHSQERNIALIADLIEDGRLKVAPLLSRTFLPERAQDAYEALANCPETVLGAVFDWTGS